MIPQHPQLGVRDIVILLRVTCLVLRLGGAEAGTTTAGWREFPSITLSPLPHEEAVITSMSRDQSKFLKPYRDYRLMQASPSCDGESVRWTGTPVVEG